MFFFLLVTTAFKQTFIRNRLDKSIENVSNERHAKFSFKQLQQQQKKKKVEINSSQGKFVDLDHSRAWPKGKIIKKVNI